MTNPKDRLSNRQRHVPNGDEDIVTDEDNYQDIGPNSPRAIHLHNLYSAFKGAHENITFRRKTKNPAIISVFSKIARKLDEEERRSGEEVEDRLFVLALFLRYGKNTYPGHLLGRSAIDIYHEQLGRLCYTVHTPKKNTDDELLKYLCEVRDESEEEVMYALEGAGLFSSAFIKKWKEMNSEERRGRCRRRIMSRQRTVDES